MDVSKARKFQFINSSLPRDAVSTEVQRGAHSHAARIAHAKTRRLRMENYQVNRDGATMGSSRGINHTSQSKSSVLSTPHTNDFEELVLPSPISKLLASDRRDPFHSFARPFKPIEHFLLDHYVRAVIPYMNTHCNKLENSVAYVDLMTKEWLRLTLSNGGSLSGMFLAACRHLLNCQQQQEQQLHYIQQAIEYKLSCVQALREAISHETPSLVSDSTIAMGVLLAYDELRLGDLQTFKSHLRGLVQMVEHNGGPQTLGANGFLERLVGKLVVNAKPACDCKYTFKCW